MPSLVGKQIGSTGFGLMGSQRTPFSQDVPSNNPRTGLPLKTPPLPDSQVFAAMRAALASGSNFWNAGEFYGTPERNTQTILAAYFKVYPGDASKVVLSVKGAFDLATMSPDGSPAGVKKSIDRMLEDLDGTKTIDVFECARVDPKVPLETTLKFLEEEYVKKGIIGGIALSEVGEATIRRAAEITKIVAVEVELSLWSTHVLENGVAAACAELDIPLVA